MKVILSIKPEFVEKILKGEKKFEFRRHIFKKNVDKVIVYASSPVKALIGEFTIDEILENRVDLLWELTKKNSGISKEFFYKYFNNKNTGYAIKIKNFLKYEHPINLSSVGINYPPQSYVYIKDSILVKKCIRKKSKTSFFLYKKNVI
jgi:predicted transcriptional regulator